MSERIMCRVYDSDGKLVQECHIGTEPDVPTHGSISLLVQGQWINFITSEWLSVSVTIEPDTHETQFQRTLAESAMLRGRMKAELKQIPLDNIHIELADAWRVPSSYLGEGIDELAKAMIEQGQVNPIDVRLCTEVEQRITGRKYRILPNGGVRRVVAMRVAHKPEVQGYIAALVHDSNPTEPPAAAAAAK